MVDEQRPTADDQPTDDQPTDEQRPTADDQPADDQPVSEPTQAIDMSTESPEPAPGERLGVYVCHCGGNISDYVDVNEVAEVVGREEGVTIARHVTFMCSDEGQQKITEDIKELELDRVIVAACTPSLHETTFRKAGTRPPSARPSSAPT